MTEIEFHGGKFRLYMNGSALFNIYDRYGAENNLLDLIEPEDKKGFEALIWIVCELSRQGEMYARLMGLEPEKPLDYARTLTFAKPVDYADLKAAAVRAIGEGFRRDHPDEELEEDAFLREFESQKNKITKAQYLRMATKLLGLSVAESMMLPPGVILDMLQLSKPKEKGAEDKWRGE